MQNRQRYRRSLKLAAAAAILAVPVSAVSQEAQRGGTAITVSVSNIRNTDGVVRACITRNADRFPRCQGSAESHRVVVPAGQAAILHFTNVAPGTYAIALLHDENNNGRADRTLGMMPHEGFGFSRDAKVRMGPPKFNDAAIQVGHSPMRQNIRMRYIL